MAARVDPAASGAAGERHDRAVVVDGLVRRWFDQRPDGAASIRTGPFQPAHSVGTDRLPTAGPAIRVRQPGGADHGVVHAGALGKPELPAIHAVVRQWAYAAVERGQLDGGAWPTYHGATRDGRSGHL